MKKTWILLFTLWASLSLLTGCIDTDSTANDETEEQQAEINDSNDAGNSDDIEGPANLSVLTQFAGNYTVTGIATDPESRGFSDIAHTRRSITIGEDGSIDFDTDISFAVDEINAIYDRTMLDHPIKRVHVNYQETDSGDNIQIYLTNESEVEEITFNPAEGTSIRAAVEKVIE